MLLALLPALLVTTARADAAPAECAQTEIWVTSPAPLATDVPLDVVPAGLATTGNCGASAWTAELSIPSTGEVVASVTHDISDGNLIEVDPGADLLPDTTYTLRFDAVDGGGISAEIGFTTGSGHTVGLEEAPTVVSVNSSWAEGDGTTFVQAELGAAAAAEGATFVALRVDGRGADLGITSVVGPAVVLLSGTDFFDTLPEEVCVVARQRDLAGVWTESDPGCAAPSITEEEPRGCFGGGNAVAPPAFGLLLIFGLARRSRR